MEQEIDLLRSERPGKVANTKIAILVINVPKIYHFNSLNSKTFRNNFKTIN